jgi:hypothetical protein
MSLSTNRSGAMRMFLVTFHKTVSDDTGHDHRILQRQILVQASTEVSALWDARARFCKALGIADWRFRADGCELAEVSAVAA